MKKLFTLLFICLMAINVMATKYSSFEFYISPAPGDDGAAENCDNYKAYIIEDSRTTDAIKQGMENGTINFFDLTITFNGIAPNKFSYYKQYVYKDSNNNNYYYSGQDFTSIDFDDSKTYYVLFANGNYYELATWENWEGEFYVDDTDDVGQHTGWFYIVNRGALFQRLADAALVENKTENLQNVIATCTNVCNSSNSTQEQIDAALNALNDAIMKEPLAKKVAEASKVANPSDALVAAIASAIDVIDTANATQALVDGALADLESAMMVSTAINNAAVATAKVSKYIENGKVVIVKNGKKFTVAGQREE